MEIFNEKIDVLLSSGGLSRFVLSTMKKFKITNESEIKCVALLIYDVFTGQTDLKDTLLELKKGGISDKQALQISQYLKENLFDKYNNYLSDLRRNKKQDFSLLLVPENKPKPEKPMPRLEGNIVDLRADRKN